MTKFEVTPRVGTQTQQTNKKNPYPVDVVGHQGKAAKAANMKEDGGAGWRWAAPFSAADLDPREPFNELSFKYAQAD